MGQTEKIVEGMLKENTGRHFLDSGGAYGRNWELNQTREFDKELSTIVSFRYGIEVTHSVYHWITEHLSYDEELQAVWDEYRNLPENEETHDLGLMETFPEWLRDEKGHEIRGVMGDPDYRPFIENTYNHECLLSQTIQFGVFRLGRRDDVFMLSVHGGCDVRGGYSNVKIFRGDFESFLGYPSATIGCSECEASWYTDNAYRYYANDRDYKDLNDYPSVKHEDEHEGMEVTAPAKGIIYINEKDEGICPVCAKGKLVAGY